MEALSDAGSAILTGPLLLHALAAGQFAPAAPRGGCRYGSLLVRSSSFHGSRKSSSSYWSADLEGDRFPAIGSISTSSVFQHISEEFSPDSSRLETPARFAGSG